MEKDKRPTKEERKDIALRARARIACSNNGGFVPDVHVSPEVLKESLHMAKEAQDRVKNNRATGSK